LFSEETLANDAGYVWQMITDQSGWQIDQRKGYRIRRQGKGEGLRNKVNRIRKRSNNRDNKRK
jgi:hypothetical protein